MARQPAASSAVSDTRWIASSVFNLRIVPWGVAKSGMFDLAGVSRSAKWLTMNEADN
jgi:hypothetical protein